jgi:oligopeptide transport system substrate-binding protein
MEAILVDEAPMLPVYFYTNVVLMDPSVKGWYPTILNNHPYKYVYLEAE